jgi:hypothetical protein
MKHMDWKSSCIDALLNKVRAALQNLPGEK